MTHIQQLETRIARLEECIDLLMGKPRGPITMTEARLANERGDFSIVERFNRQEDERILAERRLAASRPKTEQADNVAN